MSSIPDSLKNIGSVAGMLQAFSPMIGGRVAARFAIFPITDITIDTVHLQRFGWKVEIRERVPFFAHVTHNDFEDSSDHHEISDSPLMFLAVVGSCAVLCSVAKSQLFRQMSRYSYLTTIPTLGEHFGIRVQCLP